MHQQCLFLSVEYPYSQFRHLAQIVTCTGADHSLPNVCNFITKNQRHLCKLVASKTNIRSPVFWDCRWGKLLRELGHPRRMPLYTFTFFYLELWTKPNWAVSLRPKVLRWMGFLSPCQPAIEGVDHNITSTNQCTHHVTGIGTKAADKQAALLLLQLSCL